MNPPADPPHSRQAGSSARVCAWEIIELYSRYIVCVEVAPSPRWQWCIRCALTQSTRAHYELAAMPHASCCSWQLATDNKWQLQLFVWFLINAFAQCLSNYAFGAMPPHNGYGNWKLATGNGNGNWLQQLVAHHRQQLRLVHPAGWTIATVDAWQLGIGSI